MDAINEEEPLNSPSPKALGELENNTNPQHLQQRNLLPTQQVATPSMSVRKRKRSTKYISPYRRSPFAPQFNLENYKELTSNSRKECAFVARLRFLPFILSNGLAPSSLPSSSSDGNGTEYVPSYLRKADEVREELPEPRLLLLPPSTESALIPLPLLLPPSKRLIDWKDPEVSSLSNDLNDTERSTEHTQLLCCDNPPSPSSVSELLLSTNDWNDAQCNVEDLPSARSPSLVSYSAPVADYLLLAFNSNCTKPAEMPGLQERAREDSDSSSDEEGIEESKTETSYEEPQLVNWYVNRNNPPSPSPSPSPSPVLELLSMSSLSVSLSAPSANASSSAQSSILSWH